MISNNKDLTWDSLSKIESNTPEELQMIEDMNYLMSDVATKKIYFSTCVCPYCDYYLFKYEEAVYCPNAGCFELCLPGNNIRYLELVINLLCIGIKTHQVTCTSKPFITAHNNCLEIECKSCRHRIVINDNPIVL